MSARPRLVQEGTPIGARGQPQRRSSSTSSLTKATGGVVPEESNKQQQPYRLNTRLVVGETRFENEHDGMEIDEAKPNSCAKQRPSLTHRYVIGLGQSGVDETSVTRMEGVEDHGTKGPLVVMDGANVAYAYADSMQGIGTSLEEAVSSKKEPDARGIAVATDYFERSGVRVLIVLPTQWLRAKPRAGDQNKDNALMLTPQLELLQNLKGRGLLVTAPPADDDDAYCLLIARREDVRAKTRGEGGGFVLSNDWFRDAMERDDSLKPWLQNGSGNGAGRISFTFCDLGQWNDHGERELEFVPNPRHELVTWIEKQSNQGT